MFFYNFETLDYFIENKLNLAIREEENKLNKIIQLYNKKKINLMSITTSMIEIDNTVEKNKLEDFYNINSSLKTLFEDIDYIISLATNLKNDLINILSLNDKGLDLNQNEIKANLVEYNKQSEKLSNKIFDFENKNIDIFNSAIKLSFNRFNKKSKKTNCHNTNLSNNEKSHRVDIECTPQDNNILIISEVEQKAYLPFKYNDIKNIFKNSKDKYATIQDVVDDLYIIPLSRFENSSISRFRESFNLIRNKEHGSIIKALDLGLELMFKYELNPIVIASCQNLDELDIYLDCLDEDELFDFDCFEIKFEVFPKLSKN